MTVIGLLDSQNALEVVTWSQYCPIQSLKVDNKSQNTLNVLLYQKSSISLQKV